VTAVISNELGRFAAASLAHTRDDYQVDARPRLPKDHYVYSGEQPRKAMLGHCKADASLKDLLDQRSHYLEHDLRLLRHADASHAPAFLRSLREATANWDLASCGVRRMHVAVHYGRSLHGAEHLQHWWKEHQVAKPVCGHLLTMLLLRGFAVHCGCILYGGGRLAVPCQARIYERNVPVGLHREDHAP
jgi:hypothetical protein